MKKTIKINFKYWGYGMESNFFIKILKKDYNVVISENPDFLIFSTDYGADSTIVRKSASKIPLLNKHKSSLRQTLSNTPFIGRIFSDYIIMKQKIMPEVKTNAKKIFFSPANCTPDMSKCDWAITCDYHDKIKSNRYFVIPWYKFYCNAGKELIKKDIDASKIKNNKTKFCNFIYSNNAPFRNKFFKKLSRYKRIDAPGKSMHNMPSIETNNGKIILSLPKKGMSEWEKQKIKFLQPYKFTIAFEGKYNWAVSEKIYDAMLANTIPIYWGNPDVERDFNTKSFLNYHDFEKQIKKNIPDFFLKIPVLNFLINLLIIEPNATKRLIKRVIEIDNNNELYEKYLKEPWYNNNKLPDSLNENLIRKKLKQIFG